MKKAMVVYWSHSDNTEKIALSIDKGLRMGNMTTTLVKVQGALDLDFFDYDLVRFGFPSYKRSEPFVECRSCTEPGLERYALPFEGFHYLKLLLSLGKSDFLAFHAHMGLDKYV